MKFLHYLPQPSTTGHGLCVPKTLDTDVVVMKSAKDRV